MSNGDQVIKVGPGPYLPPVHIPDPGPIIQYVGDTVRSTWDSVWGWVSDEASSAVDTVLGTGEAIAGDVVNLIETYDQKLLASVSGFVNQAFDFAASIGNDLWSQLTDAVATIDGIITGVETIENALIEWVTGIDNITIPGLEAALGQLGIDTWNLVGGAVAGVEAWAIDNIYSPILGELVHVDDLIRADVWNLVGTVTAEIQAQINAEALTRAGEIAAVLGAITALNAYVDECGQPMCDTMGPKTDLGKLLKGFALAADLALLAELASLTEPELVDKLRQAGTMMGRLVADFEGYFSSGTETLGELFASAV